MSTFDDVFSKAKSVAETAGKKTGEMIEVARLKIQAGDMEREISSMLEGLGRLVYESRREGADAAGKMDDCCQKLDEKYEELAKARAKIDATLKRARKEIARLGEMKVQEAFKRAEVEANPQNMDKLCMYFGFSRREDFFYSVEKGEVALPDNLRKLLRDKGSNILFKYVKQALNVAKKARKSEEPADTKPKEKPKYDPKKPYLLKEEAFERNYVIAECCKPIPGDESLGFINDDGTVVVHKRS